LKALRSLSPPASAAGLAGRYASLLTESVDDYILAQARSGSADEATGAASEAQDLTLANASGHDALEAKAVARRVGFRVCGSDGAEWL
jgi:hypothetical protein